MPKEMSMSLEWFITGATRGLGAAMAKAALAAGDQVIATGRRREELTKSFGRDGDQALLLALDVTNEAEIAQSVHAALAKFGRIDVLVNNAGYSHFGMFEETTTEDVEHQYATNVFGLMNMTRAVLPSMRKQRSGHIFNVSSIGGIYGRAPGSSLYCGTKFAVEGFSESLATEVQPFGISVTIVEPGYFRTDFLDPSSARFGKAAIEDYAETAAKQRAFIQERNRKATSISLLSGSHVRT
jgi:NAD(P)-dependent dehydrogenase (short-subunit alcohol dehydrogenase family)